MKLDRQPDLFDSDLAKIQPRAPKPSRAVEAAIDKIRRHGFAVTCAGRNHRCVAHGTTLMLDSRQIVIFSRELDKSPPAVLPIKRRTKRIVKSTHV